MTTFKTAGECLLQIHCVPKCCFVTAFPYYSNVSKPNNNEPLYNYPSGINQTPKLEKIQA